MPLSVGEPFNPFGMFVGVFIPNTILRYRGLTSQQKLVMGRLFQYAGRDGKAFPKQVTLAKEVGIKVRQVKSILSQLEKLKFIKVSRPTGSDRARHKSNRYSFLWHPVCRIRADKIYLL